MSTPIEEFLQQNERQELLRFTTAGSVDDGKSTLIGRLLYDSKGVYEDQLASVQKASVNQSAGPLDFALITDGLRAEREQGITIDVAYRYFSTPKRKFIIADTPGHIQYTRNMATGASTAQVAIVLVDARNGVLAQSRRHAFIAALLGIPHVLVAVNKMDLVDWERGIYDSICDEFRDFASRLPPHDLTFVPISALLGDNIVSPSSNTPWYEGRTLLDYLETVPVGNDRNLGDFRFPVQYVLRPTLDFRGYAGQVASGIVRQGDPVMVLPSGRRSRVKSIPTYEGDLPAAFPPQSVTLCLEDEIDISRGDMLVHPLNLPHVSRRFEANLVWMSQEPLDRNKPYLVKHTTQLLKASILALRYRVDVNTLDREEAETLELNEIGAVAVETVRPLYFDPYPRNRVTGAFILIDPLTNLTCAAGMIIGPLAEERARPKLLEGLQFESARVLAAERQERYGHWPATIWLVGDVEIAWAAERKLFDRGCVVQVLADEEHPDLLPALARIANAAGLITICAVSSFDDEARRQAEETIGAYRFVVIESGDLPKDRNEAADSICRELEKRGILADNGGSFSLGSGI
ncbi:MAG: sulfate adenylyltransferase subunit CysN [Bryobacterales bacterium]|nr:sulfate adenylyltransferase subunit CysN [Bryobacterales bacterium]